MNLNDIIFSVVLYIIFSLIVMTICKWKIFLKAREPGWAAIIPLYGDYVLSNIVFGNSIYFNALIFSGVFKLFARFTELKFFSIFAGLVQIFMYIKCSINLAYSFGKGKKFIFGLIFLPFIFYPILAFGSSEYVFPKMRYII